MTFWLILIGFIIVIGFLSKIEREVQKPKEPTVEEYIGGVVKEGLDEWEKKLREVGEANGIPWDEDE